MNSTIKDAKNFFKKINVPALLICLAIPFGVQLLSYFLTRNSMELYAALDQPPLAPSGVVFPIVWTILYTLMGISSYIVWQSHSPERSEALTIYAIQLIFNFGWSALFFVMQAFLVSFIWICGLLVLIVIMLLSFRLVNKWAFYLQIPYLLWVAFATYLNAGIYFLN